MLDHPEGVLNPGPGPVALLVEGLVRTIELSLSDCLAHTRHSTPRASAAAFRHALT